MNNNSHAVNPPALLVLKRKFVRNYPGGIRVALYYSDKLKNYVSIPFTDIADNIGTVAEGLGDDTTGADELLATLQSVSKTNKPATIHFKDTSTFTVDAPIANAILKVYQRLNNRNKITFSEKLNMSAHNFMETYNFCLKNSGGIPNV